MIVITGGAGFIGSVLLWKFNTLGETNILVVDQKLKDSPKEKNLQNRHFADCLESDAFMRRWEKGVFKGRVRAVFHMGACSSTTETDTKFLRENNSLYSERLAARAAQDGVYFAYASSASVYGDGGLGYADADDLTPRLKPLNPYGQSKIDFDKWVIQKGLHAKVTGFRFFNVYGPNEYHKGDMRSLAHKGFEQIQKRGSLRLFKSYNPDYPDGGQKRDFIYVKDVAEALLWFYRHPEKKGIYNLGSGRAQTWNDLAAALFGALKKTPRIEYIEMPANVKNQYQYFTQADLSKLSRTGCPHAFADLERGIGDYVRNHLLKDNPNL